MRSGTGLRQGMAVSSSDFHPRRFIGDFIALVEAGDVVDGSCGTVVAGERYGVVVASMDMPAEDEAWALLGNRFRQLR